MNEKRNTLLIVLGIIAGIFGTWSMKDGLKYINKFQAQLPLESSSDSYKMSMTGLEVRNDSLVYMTNVEGDEQFMTRFVSEDYRNQLYKGLL